MDGLTLYAESSSPADVIYLDNVIITMTAAPPAVTASIQKEIEPVKKMAGLAFTVGAAVEPHQIFGVPGELLTKHFNSLVAENVMKMNAMQPMEGSFDWANADKIIDFTVANSMLVRFHTLEWHEQVPGWMFLDADGKDMSMETDPAKKAENKKIMLKRLETHITTIVSRYKDKVWSWDVVNEVVDSNGPEGMYRNNKWYQITGKDYIETAFRAARAAGGPNAKLYINDYSTHDPAKRDALYKLVKELLAKGVQIDGVGHQTHITIDSPSVAAIGDSIRLFGSLGLDNQITELDVSVYNDNTTAYTKVPEELIARQGWRYKELFDELMRCKDIISNVTLWGLTDSGSWLNNRPIPRKDAPLLFDDQYQAKPAYWAIVDPAKLSVQIQRISAAKGSPAIDGTEELAWKVSPWTDAKNGSGPATSFKTLWDKGFLYVLWEVTDPLLNKASSNAYEQDSVEAFMDENNAKSTAYQADDGQYRVNFDNAQSFGTNGADTRFTSAARVVPGGYVVEAAIALKTVQGAEGLVIGFDAQVNEADGSGRRKAIVKWNDPTDNSYKDTSGIGCLIFTVKK
jgi:endo-1,4-beta-xylanase